MYQITLVPGPDVLRRGVNPLGVLDELRDLGETTITTDAGLVPPLEQLDPERCYLNWTIQVKTAASPESISEAFLFFAEDSALSIAGSRPMGSWCRFARRLRSPVDAVSPPPLGFEAPAPAEPARRSPAGDSRQPVRPRRRSRSERGKSSARSSTNQAASADRHGANGDAVRRGRVR